MKILKSNILLIMLLPLALCACGGSDDDDDDITSGGTSSQSDNVNVNANNTDKSQYETRMEVPGVLKGNNYLFLVKQTEEYGINYIVEWDCIHHAQMWTCWEWNSTNSVKNWQRSNWDNGETFNGYGGKGDPFQPDPDFETEELKDYLQYRTTLADYYNSGYSRGHMCASEDRICSKEVNGQTFYLTNMHPQLNDHNTGVWSNMETKLRTWRDVVVKAGGTMYVCKGGTIGDVTLDGKTVTGVKGYISSGKVPIPAYFYMAVLKKTSSGVYSGMAFWTEHKADAGSNLSSYMISIDELEKRTGIDFFCNLPDKIEDTVESIQPSSTEWK